VSGLLRQLGMQALGRPATLRPAERLRSLPTDPKKISADADRGISETETIVASALPDSTRDISVASRIENKQLFVATTVGANERDAAPTSPAHAASANANSSAATDEPQHSTQSVARDESITIAEKINNAAAEPALRTATQTSTTSADRRVVREPEPTSARRAESPRPHAESSPARRTPERNVRHRAEAERAQAAPPDVHIHIGRIELTAVTAPAPTRRERPAATKPAMSLDEYLQLRNRKFS
jgi:hypothetical protein